MTVIATDLAPAAVGPYSQARRHGDLLFVSGQLPLDPATGTMPDDAVAQMAQSLRNIAAIAEAAGSSLANTIKTTVLVTDLSRWGELNAEYARHFQEPYPARATYQVSALPMGAKVEIEAVIAL
ncbi:Rid family detoxifying hydrolase [Devosia sp. A449]